MFRAIKIKVKSIAALFILGIGAIACSKPELGADKIDSNTFVALHLSEYETAGETVAGENDLQDFRACLFENGHMTKIYGNPTDGADGYGFRLDRNAGTLYVVTNASDMPELDALLNQGISEQEWLTMTAGTKAGTPIRFFSGSTTLSGEKQNSIRLSRNFARFDLHIRTVGKAQVERLTLEGSALRTSLFPGADIVSSDQGSVTICPDAPYTKDTPGVAFLYEHRNPEAMLRAEAIINGKRCELEAKLPEEIRRNHIYIITVTKDVADQEVQLTVEPWEKGDDLDLHPDLEKRIVIDPDRSDLPSEAQISDDGTKLILPHSQTEFCLSLDCDNELELIPITSRTFKIEPVAGQGLDGLNRFQIQKSLYAPGLAAEEIELRFRRKGLNNTYPEDRILIHLSANPVTIEGAISFDPESYAFDFGRYIDNELGRFTLPSDKELLVEFDSGEDPWIKLTPLEGENRTFRVIGGWRPNDPTANGRMQHATLVIRNAADGSARETYRITRRNYGLPVTWLHGVWWCKYNARGNSRSFDDQILSSSDPAAAAGKSVLDYLRDCTPEEFYDLWGWAYQGDSGIGMRVVEENGKIVMEGFSTDISSHINKLPARTLAPDGYELPSMEEFNRVFDATDYVWMMWSGSHLLHTPWEGHNKIVREQRRRNDIVIGDIQTPDLLYVGMSSPDYPSQEAITWYGPGAQWNADGIKHANHYNNILFGVYSPEGSGWYMAGNMSALYMQKNGAGNKDTRILRFKKSPVEYIY